ncbi:hypothetical protein PHYSODRAFT_339915 [Phytophthora sojae]|uniref:Uncharacterized protein n=1 Tax=Phytophthora sojae (strain P6497) TaxID=1094619 RepID=G5A817_PHYSP|nr:hypothetical protein PHYSODRAFT_339915 [Phytophthora sojae]EGZ08043.1 hypothetical protein PHYSODRAFT_339915 [Phytophthora sojae]|eukprot:XP_009536215.1 hypothetical protein PHYSODRAFT_339915 [Phytophthora sojae]
MLGTSPPTKLRTDARRSSNKDQPTSEQQAPSVEETKLRIHRNRRRIYQQRYRKKLCGRETTYEEEVAQLGGIPTQPTSWQVVAEYYSLFRNGLKPLVVTSDVSSECVQETHVQKRFLQANMTPDVATNSGLGVAALLAEWERLRVCYPDLRVKLVSLNHGEGDAMRAMSQRFVTITEQTLRNAFQHLING